MQQSPFSAASESTFATQASTTRASPDRLSPATVSSSASANQYSPFTSAAAYSPFTSPAATFTSAASGSPASMARHQPRSPMRQPSPSRQVPSAAVAWREQSLSCLVLLGFDKDTGQHPRTSAASDRAGANCWQFLSGFPNSLWVSEYISFRCLQCCRLRNLGHLTK